MQTIRNVRTSLLMILTAMVAQGIIAASASAQCTGTWTQRTPTVKPVARSASGMAYDSTRKVSVLFGGYLGGNVFSDETWEWDGTNWSKKTPTVSPPARSLTAMAYDSARKVSVLFGGLNGGGDTWEWDGTNWSKKTPAHTPSNRQSHAMAYDSARGVTVLFGGTTGGDETWEWDGTDWTIRSPSTKPFARNNHAIAYDEARGVVVLFGGASTLAVANDETWEWNGDNWAKSTPASSPSARTSHQLAYDSLRQVTVLFGGGTVGHPLADTWEWDGQHWLKRLPVPAPSARSFPAMAFDRARGVILLFGGEAPLSDQTWEWEGPQPYITQQPKSITTAPGQTVEFSLATNSASTVTYRWRKDGADLDDNSSISGSSTKTLKITNVTAADNGSYDCVGTNPCGTVTSSPAALTVDSCYAIDATGDCNGDHVLDACEIALDPTLDANNDDILDSCAEAPPAAAGCGECGAGSATLMPLMFLPAILRRRLRRKKTKA